MSKLIQHYHHTHPRRESKLLKDIFCPLNLDYIDEVSQRKNQRNFHLEQY